MLLAQSWYMTHSELVVELDYGLRTSLAKEVKGQMSIVTVYQTFQGEGTAGKQRGLEYRWLCGWVFTKHARFGVKRLGWVKKE